MKYYLSITHKEMTTKKGKSGELSLHSTVMSLISGPKGVTIRELGKNSIYFSPN
jgi:hypothetical protein